MEQSANMNSDMNNYNNKKKYMIIDSNNKISVNKEIILNKVRKLIKL